MGRQIGGLLIVAGALTLIRQLVRIKEDPISCFVISLVPIIIGVILCTLN